MAYDKFLEERIANLLDASGVSHRSIKMMGGLCFMVDEKMCIGIVKDLLMARVGPEFYPEAMKIDGVREMAFTGRPMKGYVFVEPNAVPSRESLKYWIDKCLDFNPKAPLSKKKQKRNG